MAGLNHQAHGELDLRIGCALPSLRRSPLMGHFQTLMRATAKCALPLIVLQKSKNALRLISRKRRKRATIADRCVFKRATKVAGKFIAS